LQYAPSKGNTNANISLNAWVPVLNKHKGLLLKRPRTSEALARNAKGTQRKKNKACGAI